LYRHADPRQQRQHVAQDMVTSNRATMMVFITLRPWHFDFWVNACQATAMEYTCTMFGVDSSSRFPFRARTNRQTDATKCYTNAVGGPKLNRFQTI